LAAAAADSSFDSMPPKKKDNDSGEETLTRIAIVSGDK